MLLKERGYNCLHLDDMHHGSTWPREWRALRRAFVLALIGIASYGALLTVWGPTPAYVHVRWVASVDDNQRQRLEKRYSLTAPFFREQRTWRYYLRDLSTSNIRTLVHDTAVDDTAFIDKTTYRAVRRTAHVPYEGVGAPWIPRALQLLAIMCAAVAVAAVLVVMVSLVPALRPRVSAVVSALADSRTITPPRMMLCAILFVSALLRVELVERGGQFYWSDESLFLRAQGMLHAIESGDPRRAFDTFDRGAYPLFTILTVIPAAVQQYTKDDGRNAALMLSVCSVLSIALVWAIVRRAGGSETEALYAATLLAISSTFFYYARHLLPYDLAMSLGLLALLVGIHRHDVEAPSRSLLCGVISGCAFLTYEGYWTLAGTAVAVHVLLPPWKGAAVVVRRMTLAALGLAALPITAALASAAVGGHFLASSISFAGTIREGLFSEGWRLPFAYLWDAEHGLTVLWGAALAWALATTWQRDDSRVLRLSLLALAIIYAGFVMTSVVLHVFVVYGRLARQLVPFFCILTAHALERLSTSSWRLRVTTWTIVGAAAVQGVLNFQQPLRQSFPQTFREAAERFVVRLPASGYEFVYAEHLDVPRADLPNGKTVMAAPHPLQYLPYTYEGLTPEQRKTLRAADITMRLVVFPEIAGSSATSLTGYR